MSFSSRRTEHPCQPHSQYLLVSCYNLKTQIFISIILILVACSDRKSKGEIITKSQPADTIVKHDTIFICNDNDWQQNFGLTHNPERDSIWGKPVKFYVENPDCSPTAIDFYWGQFRPTDNNTTEAFLKLATTNNDKLRPFYRWCLNKTIQIQDGALAEYTGVPARQYAEKFPKEFFEYMDYDTTNEKYEDWVSSISYSGFYGNEDYKKIDELRNNLTKAMKTNCKGCSETLINRVDKFAKDCFQ